MTAPLPHWPGRLVTVAPGEQVWVARTPAPSARRPQEPQEPQGPDQRGRELVLCVHGMSGAATNWTDLMGELSPEFDCAALDLPGSGFSPPPRTPAGYSVSALAGTVIRLIEALGAGPVHLIGNSMGGSVAVRVAARRPDLVRTLTLVSPALPDLRVRRSVMHFPVLALPLVGERVVRSWITRFPVENRVAGVYAACFADPSAVPTDRVTLEVEEARRRDGLGHNAVSLSRAARTLVAETLRPAPFSLWRAAARVTAPSLVLFGADDRLVNPRLAARAARTFANARVLVLPGTGHIAQIEQPGQVAALFRELVESARTSGRASGPPSGRGAPGTGQAGNAGRRDPVDA